MTKTIMFSLLLFAFFILTPPVTAEIKTLKIKDDNRPMILFEKFGFTHNGFASVAVSSVSVTSGLSQPDPSLLGFFLIAEGSRNQVLMELERKPETCVVDSKFISLLFTFQDLSPPPHSSLNKSFPVNYPDEYYLFFANCNRESLVSMDIRTELYNSEDGTHKDYLSAGKTQLPSLYFIFSIIYMCFVGLWTVECMKNKGSVHRIHLLMGMLLVVKALNLICAAENKHYVKVTGTPHGWDVLFYTFQFLRAVLLFTVIVLIGTGWSFLKPFLQEKEKKVLMIVIPLQVLANIAAIVVGETGPFSRSWVTWNQLFMIVDLICCFAIIFPIVWSIQSLRETSKTDGKAARNLAKLYLFRKFYMVVIGYLYFTRIIVFSLETISSYKFQWVSNGAQEVGSLVFYMMMFYMFRPVEKNEYFLIDDEEEKAAERTLQEEEFEL
ncbi:protein GPR107-like [Cynara cardunculus var. scolymus]|uniref:Transmembrane receptor, eukaryota n=1 Tax=Cynara cardunculus var. scolymus TaxID=59895 RepID=A0A103YIA2_CYNCS|nr:protein GPR107-like [Cynara cardunculus var. scolymus]KVI09547.1 Transmembrane receptor, eukaryota [Cynara cardunculus var. scolymus]